MVMYHGVTLQYKHVLSHEPVSHQNFTNQDAEIAVRYFRVNSSMFAHTRHVWFACGWQVKLRDPLVTHGPYLSALEIRN